MYLAHEPVAAELCDLAGNLLTPTALVLLGTRWPRIQSLDEIAIAKAVQAVVSVENREKQGSVRETG